MKSPTMKWGLLIGIPSALLALVAILSSAASWPGIPSRVSRLEDSTAVLSRKMESLQSDVTIIRRDAESSTRQAQESFRDLSSSMARITGMLQDVRDQGRDNNSLAVQAKEKAVTASVLADEANREIVRIAAEIAAGKPK